MTRSTSWKQRRYGRLLTALFFTAVLLIGLLTAADYGRPWDESDEMDILRMNLWEYARALGMDQGLFEEWAAEDRVTISRLTPIGDSMERDHGVAAFYPIAGLMLNRSLDEHSRMTLWHMWCWVLFTLGMCALYCCCRELRLSRGWSVLAALFLLLSPRFFAEGHYNNKDVVLLSLALCVLWQGLRLMREPSVSRALWFALAGAFAANTRVVGLALWGLCALLALLRQIARREWTGRVALAGGVALAGFLAFYALLTPALWRSPVGFVEYLVHNALDFGRWENYVRFRGTTFLLANQRLPWYYLPYMMAATTPLWLGLLIGLGTLYNAVELVGQRKTLLKSDRKLGLLLSMLLWLTPLAFALATRTTVYNGWRHFYFLYGFMLLTAAYGAHGLLHRMRRLRGRWAALRGVLCALLGLCMAVTGVGIAARHPYQYAYYQPAVRWATDADDLELDYWNVSAMNALQALAEQRGGELTVGYADLWAEAALRRTLPAMDKALRERLVPTENPALAEYILVNPTYALFSGFEKTGEMEEAVTVEAYGRVLMRIYRNSAAD